jgi:hypothetical protein
MLFNFYGSSDIGKVAKLWKIPLTVLLLMIMFFSYV